MLRSSTGTVRLTPSFRFLRSLAHPQRCGTGIEQHATLSRLMRFHQMSQAFDKIHRCAQYFFMAFHAMSLPEAEWPGLSELPDFKPSFPQPLGKECDLSCFQGGASVLGARFVIRWHNLGPPEPKDALFHSFSSVKEALRLAFNFWTRI